MNWMLHCQGCHKPDASGMPERGTPAMAGEVALFLSVEGGREYLTRVPGVANAGLSDVQLAELLNWTLVKFDSAHIPRDFKPFTPEAVRLGRTRVLVSEAAGERASLTRKFPAAGSGGKSGDNN
jgi:mono/diheme cytochrome c family protein